MENAQGKPRYRLVKEQLVAQIERGVLKGKIPSEKLLGERFGVSYMTARRAVGELVDAGILSREVGRGTFVIDHSGQQRLQHAILVALSANNPGGLRNPYFSHIIDTIESVARENGFATLFSTELQSYFADGERDIRPMLSGNMRISGIIATALDNRKFLERLGNQLPIVMLNNWLNPVDLPTIQLCQYEGAVAAVNHLIELGHRAIAHIGATFMVSSGNERLKGYQDAMAKANLQVDDTLIVESDFSFQGGYSAMESLALGNRVPSAVFCSNDRMALGAIKYLHEHGIRVPQQISVVGFGDIDQASHSAPALTTVHVPKEGIAKTAFLMLKQRIENPDAVHEFKPIPTSLVVRNSCASPVRLADFR